MALEAKNICFRYHKKQPWILKDYNLKVEKGERVVLLAPSGYGKTTLAMLLSGYLMAEKGEILLDGKPVSQKGIHPVQMICQHPEKAVNPRWRLKKVLEEAGEIKTDVLNTFGIEQEWLKRFSQELSGGELQRFCVARAVMSNPDYLICDEISTMLDAITQAQIWNSLLKEAHLKNMGMIIITHNKHLAQKIGTRIIQL